MWRRPDLPSRLAAWRWRWALAIVACLGAIAGGAHAAIVRWSPDELGPRRASEVRPLASGEVRVVTLNAWRMAAPERVPGYVAAIEGIAQELARAGDPRPELLAISEIQSMQAIDALEEQLGERATFAACVCSLRGDGSLREAVAAVARAPIVARSSECIDLGALVPDHPRCAALIRGELEGRPIEFVSTHLAWHPESAPMARRLADELAARGALGEGTIIAGDLNAFPGSIALGTLLERGLLDARPGAPRTHFAGGRIDYVLLGSGLAVARWIDRRASYEIVRPGAALLLPAACAQEGPPECPVSDHLPEAVVVHWARAPLGPSSRGGGRRMR